MNNLVYGYVRVSTKEQNLDRQVLAIKDYCTINNLNLEDRNIISDKASGKNFDRPGYKALTNQLLRKGDTLIIKELDRLGRSVDLIKQEWESLINKGINIIVIESPMLSTKDKTDLEKNLISSIVFNLLSYLAEKEKDKTRNRQREGIDIAKAKGIHLGRPNINLNTISKNQYNTLKEYYPRWKAKEITAVRFMDILDLKTNTFYKVLREYELATNAYTVDK